MTSKVKFSLSGSLYQYLLGNMLSQDEGLDAEQVTQIALGTLAQISKNRKSLSIAWLLRRLALDLQREDERLKQRLFGCDFKNPVGLAAGFDKNGIAAGIWDCFGFGFAELGTVTFHPQEGNPRPRLFRLAAEEAALNRMGFNNKGAEAMRDTLEKQAINPPGERPAILGLNFGKSKITNIQEAPEDYASSLSILIPLADYVVINVSSPNTPGLRDLQDSKQLEKLIQRLKKLKGCPPLLVKIAPDLDNISITNLAKVAYEEELAGIIAVNTSIDRFGLENRVILQSGLTLQEESGGLSGAPLRERALEVIRLLKVTTENKLTLIGVGGINSPKVAWERITAGASLLQLYTGWVFQGPELVPLILEGLLSQLERHGFRNISDAVGSEVPWV